MQARLKICGVGCATRARESRTLVRGFSTMSLHSLSQQREREKERERRKNLARVEAEGERETERDTRTIETIFGDENERKNTRKTDNRAETIKIQKQASKDRILTPRVFGGEYQVSGRKKLRVFLLLPHAGARLMVEFV